MFWPIRRSSLCLASTRFVIRVLIAGLRRKTQAIDYILGLRIAPSSAPTYPPPVTGRVGGGADRLCLKRRLETTGRETQRGPQGPHSALALGDAGSGVKSPSKSKTRLRFSCCSQSIQKI